jgi:hypothetical protein
MKYILKFSYTTTKVNSDGSINGGIGGCECNIESDYSFDELNTKTDYLKSVAYDSIKDDEKIKNIGVIQSVDIVGIVAC